MSKFIRTLALFVAGLPLSSTRAATAPAPTAPNLDGDNKAVSLRPLNFEMDNLFASHRSHSSHASHASHASHYSGSGGSLTSPMAAPSAPSTTYPTGTAAVPANAAMVAQVPSATSTQPSLTMDEKRRLQVLRVQMRLNSLQLYDGPIDGTFNDTTKGALKLFQKVKGIPATGLMSTSTLNALNIPAVQ